MTMLNPYGSTIDAVAVASVAALIASLTYAFLLRKATHSGKLSEAQVRARGYLLIGCWVLMPPIWFFLEYQFLHPNMAGDAMEAARVVHAQELARNIWLAFVVVLSSVVGVTWPPSGSK